MTDQIPTTAAEPDRRHATAFTAMAAAILSIALATIGRPDLHASLLARFGNSWSDLANLRLTRLATGAFIQADPGLKPGILFLIIASVVLVWTRVDGLGALGFWFIADAVACIVLYGGYRLAATAGSERAVALLTTRDGGSSSGGLAILTAAVLTMANRRLRMAAIAALVGVQVPILLETGNPAYIHHMIAITTTVGLVLLVDHFRPSGTPNPHHSRPGLSPTTSPDLS